ncbi:MAG: TolC family protein [Halothece sp.]
MQLLRYVCGVSAGTVIAFGLGEVAIADHLISPNSVTHQFSFLKNIQKSRELILSQSPESLEDIPLEETEDAPPEEVEDLDPEVDTFEERESLEPVEETDSLDPSSNPLQLPTREEEVEVDEVTPITLEQAIELARENNQTFKEARLNVRQAREQLNETLGTEFPSLNLESQLQRTSSPGAGAAVDPLTGQQQAGVINQLSTRLQLSYNLYTGGERPAQIRVAESELRTQQLALEQAAEQLRFDVTDAYYGVQQADSEVQIAEAAVADAEQSLRDAQLLQEAGLGTRFDVLQAEVQLSNEEQQLTRALSEQRVNRRQLAEALGVGQQVEVTAANPPEVAGDWDLSLEESILLAYQNRAELEQQLEQRQIGENNRTIALSQKRPQISLFTNYEVQSDLDSSPTDSLQMGAQLNWNLYDGGSSRARARQAEEEIAIAENRFQQTRNEVRREVEQAFFNLDANEQNIETAEIAIEQAEESLRLARLRFQAGVGTQTDVINAQSELTRARGNLLTAIIDYNRSLAALERAVSNLPDSRVFDQS